MSPALKTILCKDAATFHSKFGANVSILITLSPAHMRSQPPPTPSKPPTPFFFFFLSACNRKKKKKRINQQFSPPLSEIALHTHEGLTSHGTERRLIDTETHRRNHIPPHSMSARKGSAGRRQLHTPELADRRSNGILNNAKLKGRMWAAARELMFSCTDAAMNQIFNIVSGIRKHGSRFGSKRGLTVIGYLHINKPAA